jgi:hypothetical protein
VARVPGTLLALRGRWLAVQTSGLRNVRKQCANACKQRASSTQSSCAASTASAGRYGTGCSNADTEDVRAVVHALEPERQAAQAAQARRRAPRARRLRRGCAEVL